MAHSFIISIKKFVDDPYSEILGYPKATSRQIKSRINELTKLKIKSISLTGPTTLGKLERFLEKDTWGKLFLQKKAVKKLH